MSSGVHRPTRAILPRRIRKGNLRGFISTWLGGCSFGGGVSLTLPEAEAIGLREGKPSGLAQLIPFRGRRWMPSHRHPAAAGTYQVIVVHLKSVDCSTACRGQPYDPCAIFTPTEMVMPSLPARVKERHAFTGLRVNSVSSSTLMTIAQGACQPEVVLLRGSSGSYGDDVFHVHRHRCEGLRGQAVAATIAGLGGYFFTQCLGNVGSRHQFWGGSCIGTRYPRRAKRR